MAAMSSRCAAISGWSPPSWAGHGASVESAGSHTTSVHAVLCTLGMRWARRALPWTCSPHQYEHQACCCCTHQVQGCHAL